MLIKVPIDSRNDFERKFAWLGKHRPFLTSLRLNGWLASDSPQFIFADIAEINTGEPYSPNDIDPLEELAQILSGLQALENEGLVPPDIASCELTLSKNRSVVLSHWAFSNNYQTLSIQKLVPSRLLYLLPNNALSRVNRIGDLIALLPEKNAPSKKHLLLTHSSSIKPFNPTLKSFPDLARALKFESHSLTSGDRLWLYEALLPGSYALESEIPNLNPCFLERFCRIVSSGTICPRSVKGKTLAARFFNRSVDINGLFSSESPCSELVELDFPLHAKLKALNFAGLYELAESIFACTLDDQFLTRLWDVLLVASPRLLGFVISLTLIEVRSAVLECGTEEELRDVVLSAAQLIDNFPSIIDMATNQDSTEPL